MYIDECGNSDLLSSNDPNHRFLSLTGVIIDLAYVQSTLNRELELLKEQFFRSHPDEPIILHRREIVNAMPPFHTLKKSSVRALFDAELLRLLQQWDYTVITVCLDKQSHRRTYTTWQYDPYHYCLEILLERYVFFLEQHGANGDVIAESRGGKEDRRLKASFERLWEGGTHYVTATRLQQSTTSKQLKVKPKANNISGLQLADLIAHPSRNEILKSEGFTSGQLAPFAARIIAILQTKYYNKSGIVEGCGKKFV